MAGGKNLSVERARFTGPGPSKAHEGTWAPGLRGPAERPQRFRQKLALIWQTPSLICLRKSSPDLSRSFMTGWFFAEYIGGEAEQAGPLRDKDEVIQHLLAYPPPLESSLTASANLREMRAGLDYVLPHPTTSSLSSSCTPASSTTLSGVVDSHELLQHLVYIRLEA